MSEFKKRIITSFFLLLIIFFSFLNLISLSLFLFILTFITLVELHNMYKKIYKKKFFFLFVTNFFSVLYLGYFSFTVILFLSNEFLIDKFVVLYLLIICISTDIGGYVFGKIIGGKKLTKISPNKTISGSIGSFVFSLIPIILFTKLDHLKIELDLYGIIFSLLISLVSQFGDLLISYLKRKAKIKDTGKILPGHGGLLDRIDGLIFVMPVYFILRLFI